MKAHASLIVAVILIGAQIARAQSDGVPFVTLAHGPSSVRFAQDRVIADVGTFTQFWEEAYPDADSRPPLPQVDFGRRIVVVAASGHPSPGHQIRIDRIARRGTAVNAVEVIIRQTRVSRLCGIAPNVAYNLHVIETDYAAVITFRRVGNLKCAGGE